MHPRSSIVLSSIRRFSFPYIKLTSLPHKAVFKFKREICLDDGFDTEMTSQIGEQNCLLSKIAQRSRQKRLRILRIKHRTVFEMSEFDGILAGEGDCLKTKTSPALRQLHLQTAADFESSSHSPENRGGTVGKLVSGDEVEHEEDQLNELSHGVMSVMGRRRTMEDAAVVERELFGGDYLFFAVYDGHGGSRVSNICRRRLHQIVAEEIEGSKENEAAGIVLDWVRIMNLSFEKMEAEVNTNLRDGIEGDDASSLVSVGSTAVVVVVGKEEVVVANCGDSRAVLCSAGVALPLSVDHKPDRPDETVRVEAAGGRVINWNGSRVCGILSTSRSLGDQHLKPYVISEPEVTVTKRTGEDEFLIIASDGLWDVMSNKFACNFVRKCLRGQIRKNISEGNRVEEAATMLAELAMAKGSCDNISVIVVELIRPRPTSS